MPDVYVPDMRTKVDIYRRLTRLDAPSEMHKAIVGAMASAVGAQYGALAVFARREGALRISATYGYPAAIVLMVLAAVLPYVFFRWKRWL